MSDSVTSVEYSGWFTRIKNSIVGLLLGIVLIPGSVGILGWNEYRTVHRTRGLEEGAGVVQSIEDPNTHNPDLNRKLIHTTSVADTDEVLSDRLFNIKERSIHLVRNVDMYQWVETQHTETRKKLGGGKKRVTTYTYDTEWAPGRIDSGQFHESEGHKNPSESVSEKSFTAEHVKVGTLEVSENLKSQIDSFETIPWTKESHAKLDPRLAKISAPDGKFLYVSEKARKAPAIRPSETNGCESKSSSPHK